MISILLPYKTPGVEAGGPIKSIGGVCNYLENQYDYIVLVKNDDFINTSIEDTLPKKKVQVLKRFSVSKLLPIFNVSSVIWINSVYSITFSFVPLIALLFSKKKSVLISTRGQLLAGAMSFKKKMYLKLYRYILKTSGHSIYIHYTTEEERETSFPIFKNFPNVIFANPLVEKNHTFPAVNNNSGFFVIGFFGRVAPIKNIEFIIKLLPNLPNHFVFHVYGVVTDISYKAKLEKLAKKLQLQNRVTFQGAYAHNKFTEYVQQVALVVVPSLSENFCYTFFETIENKKPIIGSTGLPWKSANDYEPGTILPLKETKWVDKIMEIATQTQKINVKKQYSLYQFYKFVATSIKQDTLLALKKIAQKDENKQ